MPKIDGWGAGDLFKSRKRSRRADRNYKNIPYEKRVKRQRDTEELPPVYYDPIACTYENFTIAEDDE